MAQVQHPHFPINLHIWNQAPENSPNVVSNLITEGTNTRAREAQKILPLGDIKVWVS